MATQTAVTKGGGGDAMNKKRYEGRLTPYVLCTVAVATCLSLAGGYQINIAGTIQYFLSCIPSFHFKAFYSLSPSVVSCSIRDSKFF